jgi:hypothetical protein
MKALPAAFGRLDYIAKARETITNAESTERLHHCFRAVAYAQFFENVIDIRLDGSFSDEQRRPDQPTSRPD